MVLFVFTAMYNKKAQSGDVSINFVLSRKASDYEYCVFYWFLTEKRRGVKDILLNLNQFFFRNL